MMKILFLGSGPGYFLLFGQPNALLTTNSF